MNLKHVFVLLLVAMFMAVPVMADEPEDLGLDQMGSLSGTVDASEQIEMAQRAAHFAGATGAVVAMDVSDVLQFSCPNGVVPTHEQVMADLKNHGQSSSGSALADGTATVVNTNASGLGCTYEVGFASYKKYDNVLYNQTLFDSMTVMVGPGELKELQVELPGCAVQIDFFYGPPIVEFKPNGQGNIQYWSTGIDGKDRKLGYNHPGGYSYCLPDGEEPPACDYSLQGLDGVADTQSLSGIANIQAIVNNYDGNTRVDFNLTGPQNISLTENVYPYYFFGDNGENKPKGWDTDSYPQGDYLLTVNVINKVTNQVCGSTDVRFTLGKTTLVDLVYFNAQSSGDSAILYWQTAAEINNAGFNLYRATSEAGPFVQVNDSLVVANASSAVSGASYSFVDHPGAGSYVYMLEDVEFSGTTTQHGPVAVNVTPRMPLVPVVAAE